MALERAACLGHLPKLGNPGRALQVSDALAAEILRKPWQERVVAAHHQRAAGLSVGNVLDDLGPCRRHVEGRGDDVVAVGLQACDQVGEAGVHELDLHTQFLGDQRHDVGIQALGHAVLDVVIGREDLI